MVKTAKNNIGDINRWLREFIRITIRDTFTTGLPMDAAKEVLPLWCNEYHAKMKEVADEYESDLKKNAEELEKLGYDTEGNPIVKK